MIELCKEEYPLLKELFPDDHPYVEVPMIVNGRRGRAWVDKKKNPCLGLITTGCMIFIEGDGDPELLESVFTEFSSFYEEINCDKRFGDRIFRSFEKVHETSNIIFEHDGRKRDFPIQPGINVVEIDEAIFDRLDETGENWLSSMFDDGEDFVRNSYGFAVLVDGVVASAAVAFGIDSHRADIGVGTYGTYRNKGYSTLCASACVNRTLERNLNPVWMTGPDNIASQCVALKIGFTPIFELPSYWIGD